MRLIFGSVWLFCFGLVGLLADESQLTWLKNDRIEVGLLPEVGGRIVVFRVPGGANVLFEKKELWNLPQSERVDYQNDSNTWVLFGGSFFWMGPRSGFGVWMGPDSEASKKRWPPDPYWNHSPQTVLEQSESHIVMQGPGSPNSGIQLKREIRITEEGKMLLEVTMENISAEPIVGDIWTVTQVAGAGTITRVPLGSTPDVRVDYRGHNKLKGILLEDYIEDGVFVMNRFEVAEWPVERASCKAFINTDVGLIEAFLEDQIFALQLERTDHNKTGVFKEHGLVEIYHSMNQDAGKNYVELEFHGPIAKLEPGESTSRREFWSLKKR